MRHLTLSLCLVLVASVLLSGCALFGGSKAIELSLKLKPGDVYSLETINDQYIQQTVMGSEQNIDQTIGYTYRQEIKSLTEDGNYQVQVTYDRVIFEQEGPMGNIAYDSEDPPEQIPAPALGYAAMVDKSFELVMSPRGKVIDVSGVDAMLDQIFDEVAEQQPLNPQMRESLKQQMGEEGIKNNLGGLTNFYPDNPVKVGDHWQVVQDRAGMTALHLETDYVLAKVEDGVLSLGAKSEISPVADAPPTQMGSMELSYALSGQQSGTLRVDQETGLLQVGSLVQNLSGDIKMTGGPAGEMEWPILIETKITMKQL
jgi:hypothetical protein